jgi:hypothetical protein
MSSTSSKRLRVGVTGAARWLWNVDPADQLVHLCRGRTSGDASAVWITCCPSATAAHGPHLAWPTWPVRMNLRTWSGHASGATPGRANVSWAPQTTERPHSPGRLWSSSAIPIAPAPGPDDLTEGPRA